MVANEVQNPATQTAKATEDISSQISSMRGATAEISRNVQETASGPQAVSTNIVTVSPLQIKFP